MNEYKIVKYFNSNFSFTDPMARILSNEFYLGIILFLISAFSLAFDRINGIKIFFSVAIVAILQFIISEFFLKRTFIFFRRTRPYLAHPDVIKPIGRILKDSSFPSNHTSISMAVSVVYFYHYPQYWPLLVIFVLFLAFSRIHCGMHYLTDVLAGIILGIAYGALALMIVI